MCKKLTLLKARRFARVALWTGLSTFYLLIATSFSQQHVTMLMLSLNETNLICDLSAIAAGGRALSCCHHLLPVSFSTFHNVELCYILRWYFTYFNFYCCTRTPPSACVFFCMIFLPTHSNWKLLTSAHSYVRRERRQRAQKLRKNLWLPPDGGLLAVSTRRRSADGTPERASIADDRQWEVSNARIKSKQSEKIWSGKKESLKNVVADHFKCYIYILLFHNVHVEGRKWVVNTIPFEKIERQSQMNWNLFKWWETDAHQNGNVRSAFHKTSNLFFFGRWTLSF